MRKIAIVNGVNLSELGIREVDIYGSLSFEEYLITLKNKFSELELHYFYCNSLDKFVETLHACKNFDGIILNPGAYTHTSIVLADTLRTIAVPAIEVHISNIFARESYRKNSLVAAACTGSISGLGLAGYEVALHFFTKQ